ncbi:helix-turn-helix domain-containing protein [Xylocopilactobacillus apis]|uniref:XRE family transcriptional regulator n=1 Tax=Xylocopilactobacillus apis TaxID=2932183 RepID=A0AAU9D360_9LACO|nr:helix-turn-helix domain-containing protein [Xylocopilactobacillus apis]BDR56735.1 XRE family transcriptional regulator [Xylocopilactobacillus apis]
MDNIGKILRQARIDQGMTIDDLQKKTRIQKRYLIAIENGDFDQLPGQFYVKAFVKQYGEYVGVDTDPYFAQSNKTEDPDQETEIYDEDESEMEKDPISSSPYLTRHQDHSRWHSLIPQILVISAVVLVVFVLWFLYQSGNKGNPKITDKGNVTKVKESSSSQMHKSSSVASKSSSSKIQSSKSSSSKNEQTKVSLKAQSDSAVTFEVTGFKKSGNTLVLKSQNGNSWDQVQINNNTAYSGMVSDGQSQTVQIPEGVTSFSVTLGATTNSKISINGQDVDLSSITTQGVSNLTFNVKDDPKEN